MPNWSTYFGSYDAGTASSSDFHITVPISWEQDYKEYIQERERQNCVIEQMLQGEAERAEDRRRFPLFFWREGIVYRVFTLTKRIVKGWKK